MPDRRVNYLITTDSKQAEQGFQKLEDKVSKLASSLKNQILQYASLGATIGFLKKSIDAYIETEERNLKLQQILINTGKYRIDVYNDLISWTTKLQREIGIEDDKIQEVARTLLGLGAPIEKIKELTQVVIDFGYFLNGDVNSAVMIVGRAFEGSTARLKQFGIEISKTNDKMQIADELITQLGRNFKDFTKTALSGTKGEIEKFKGEISNLMEDIGDQIILTAKNAYDSIRFVLATGTQGIIGYLNVLRDYQNNYNEFFKRYTEKSFQSSLQEHFYETLNKANQMTKEQIKDAIKWLEIEQKRTDISEAQKQINASELRAYRQALNEKLAGAKKEDEILKDLISKKKTDVEITELNYQLNKSNADYLINSYSTYLVFLQNQLKKLQKNNQYLEVQKVLLREILETQNKLQNIIEVQEQPNKLFQDAIDSYNEFIDNVETLPDVEIEEPVFITMLKNSFMDLTYFIESEWRRVWRKNFGDTENLFTVFMESLTSQFISYASTWLLTSYILPFFGILHSGGIVKAHSGTLTRDETPIIARKGEMILTKQQQYNLFSMLQRTPTASNPVINIYIGNRQVYQEAIEPNIYTSLNKVDKIIRR